MESSVHFKSNQTQALPINILATVVILLAAILRGIMLLLLFF